MWRSGAILLVWLVAGCAPAGVTQSVDLLGGAVVATAPQGYCVDPQSSRVRTGFAVFAPCASLGVDMPAPAVLALATVQAGAAGSAMVAGQEGTLRDFLESPAGTRLLSGPRAADTITVVSSRAFDGRVAVQFDDRGPPPIAGLGQAEWRAFTDVAGRLVTVSVRGLDDAPLGAARGYAFLDRLLAGVGPAPAAPR